MMMLQGKNHDNGRHIHHTSTQHHCCEHLLMGWVRVSPENGEGTAMLPQWHSHQNDNRMA